MVDVLTDNQRKYCMSQIKGKNTKPEMIVRRLVYSLGYRYRLHVKSLPGNPDLVFSSRKKVIFVHGCFWHRHNCKYGKPKPATRKNFWEKKLQGNVQRDKVNIIELEKQGWKVLVIWECEIKNIENVMERIINFLNITTHNVFQKNS